MQHTISSWVGERHTGECRLRSQEIRSQFKLKESQNIVIQEIGEDHHDHEAVPQENPALYRVEAPPRVLETAVAPLEFDASADYSLPAPRFREYVQVQ